MTAFEKVPHVMQTDLPLLIILHVFSATALLSFTVTDVSVTTRLLSAVLQSFLTLLLR